MNSDITIIDTNEVDWISGPDILAGMNENFRSNLGPSEEVDDAFEHYLVKPLLREEGTGRRFDLAAFTPGYRDATACYHESAEEGFCIDGSFDLAFEGHFEPTSYFWRPPGWVHGTIKTDRGATALFSFEADRPEDGSGPVTREVCSYEDAGTNPLLAEDDPRYVGPRGYLPNVSGRFQARQRGAAVAVDDAAAQALHADALTVRVLSRNVNNGGGTFLWDLDPGYETQAATFAATYHFFVVSGQLTVEGQEYGAGTWVYVPAGVKLGAVASRDGAQLYMKADEAFALLDS